MSISTAVAAQKSTTTNALRRLVARHPAAAFLLISAVFLNALEAIGCLGFLQARLQGDYGLWKACLLVEIPFVLWHLSGLLSDTGGQLSLALMMGCVFAEFQLCGRFVNMYAGEFLLVPDIPWFFIVSGVVAVAAVLIILLTRGRLSYRTNQEMDERRN